MAELHESLAEFIKDTDGEYSYARLLSCVAQLEKEGYKTRSIARASVDLVVHMAGRLPTGLDDRVYLKNAIAQLERAIALGDEVTRREMAKEKGEC